MARPTLFKKGPLSAAERQRRHRKKLKAERSAEVRRRIANREREEQALEYHPAPPGITYYREVTIRPEHVGRTVWQPTRRPLARCDNHLEDEEIVGLLCELKFHAVKRGLAVDWEALEPRHHSGFSVCGDDPDAKKPQQRPNAQADLFEREVLNKTFAEFAAEITGEAA